MVLQAGGKSGELSGTVGGRLWAWIWLLPIGLGLLCLYLPSYIDLAHTVWASDEQGHGPIILAISIWLIWRRRAEFELLESRPALVSGIAALIVGLLLYLLGRTQQLDTFEITSQIVVLSAIVLLLKGWQALRLMAFPLFFMIFMVPLPSIFVQIVTTPLKSAVSYVAENILYSAGYPVSRSGVIIAVGPYQLLVADACAGLNSMFTLEALGLLYMNIVGYTSVARNALLAILIIPISFAANVIRVMILILVTYHLGDEAGQGFVHGLAGMVLFLVALTLMLITDSIIGWLIRWRGRSRGTAL